MQGATVVVMTFRENETGPQPTTIRNQWENQRQRNEGLVLEKSRFNRNALDRYVELLNFQLEVMNILESRVYEINDEERRPVIKNWLVWEGLFLMGPFTQEEKVKCKIIKGLFLVLSARFKLCHNYITLYFNTKIHTEKAVSLSRNGWANCK